MGESSCTFISLRTGVDKDVSQGEQDSYWYQEYTVLNTEINGNSRYNDQEDNENCVPQQVGEKSREMEHTGYILSYTSQKRHKDNQGRNQDLNLGGAKA